MARRLALLIGNSKFIDAETFPELRTPGNDAHDLAELLEKNGDFEIVGVLLDEDAQTTLKEIERFYKQAERGDLTLLYYSGHGYRDANGVLYLVARDTNTGELLTTAVRESFINQAMEYSNSRHRIIILDCCFSGAFIEGRKGGPEESVVLEKLRGQATALLTSSSRIQYSFQDEGRNSLFTHYLLEGIGTGDADEDRDGYISVDELFEYVDPKVREKRREQTPMRQVTERGGRIYIARNPNPPDPTITRLSPEGTPLALSSFVIQGLPASDWLAQLDTEKTRRWIREFEEEQDGTIEPSERREKRREQARLLLGISDENLPEQPASADFGRLTWLAVAHPNRVWRETATLALIEGYSIEAVARVEAAVREGGLSRWRLAELHAIMSDGQDEIEDEIEEKTRERRLDRFEVWWWRFYRRVMHDRSYIFPLAISGGLGAGFGLGLLRALLALLLEEESGFFFYGAVVPAFLLGSALALGLLLITPGRLKRPEHGPGATEERPMLPAVVFGSLFFTMMHVLQNIILKASGLIEAPLIPPLALVAGVGLSLAVYDQPLAGWRIGVRRWGLRLTIVACVFALVQFVFFRARDYGPGLIFAWSGFFYQSRLRDPLIHWGLESVLSIENWFHYAAVIDAALTGIAMAVGLSAGLIAAHNWYQRWERLVNQVVD
ncbi:MAG: hypothetical protein Kow0063_04330 [Anaerolineae bacterium]